jgi:hypothetical protein
LLYPLSYEGGAGEVYRAPRLPVDRPSATAAAETWCCQADTTCPWITGAEPVDHRSRGPWITGAGAAADKGSERSTAGFEKRFHQFDLRCLPVDDALREPLNLGSRAQIHDALRHLDATLVMRDHQ